MPQRAAIYCRISEDRTGAGLGVERQREDCEALARRIGAEVVSLYTDNDVSAYSGRARPGYVALLDGIRAGSVDVVLAWHEDRLHRSPRELEDYIDACAPGEVATRFVQAGELDLVTASGRMTARIRGAVSRAESEHKAERVRRAQLQAARAGRWLGGARPYGWNVHPDGSATLNTAEAREVRRACEAILSGASIGGMVADMNARGLTTATGRPWNHTSLRQVVRRPRNAGLSVLHGEVLGKLTWPAIVSETTWRGVCAVLDDPARIRSTSNRVRHLLAGIATCGAPGCGLPLKSASMTTRTPGVYRKVYRCDATGGGHVARDVRAVDEHVVGVLLGVLAKPQSAPALAVPGAPSAESMRLEAVALRAQMGEAADLFGESKITGAQLAKITGRLQERLDDAEAGMARAARGTALAPFRKGRDPESVWKSLSMDRKRDVIRELMTVTVLPSGRRGKVYDPELVRIEPREQS
jgi:site-specific DNA recombinase